MRAHPLPVPERRTPKVAAFNGPLVHRHTERIAAYLRDHGYPFAEASYFRTSETGDILVGTAHAPEYGSPLHVWGEQVAADADTRLQLWAPSPDAKHQDIDVDDLPVVIRLGDLMPILSAAGYGG